MQSNIHKQSKTYLFELRGCLLTNTRETSVSSTGNNKTTKHFKRPPVPRYRWCLMPGCSSWEHGAKTLPFKLKRWLSLSESVPLTQESCHCMTSLAKKNPGPLVGQSASSCWVAKKKEKIDSVATVATKLPSFLLCRSSSVPREWLYALSWPFTSSRIKLVNLITKKKKSTARHLTLLKSLAAGSSGSFVSV